MNFFLAQLINGVLAGSSYALIAIGFTMVYSVLGLINFANASTYTLGAFIGYAMLDSLGTGPDGVWIAVTLIVVFLVSGLLGVGTELIAFRPLRNRSSVSVLISALGVFFILENFVGLVWGVGYLFYPVQLPRGIVFQSGLIVVQLSQLIVFAIAIVLVALVYLFMEKTILGKTVSATANDRSAASLAGIKTDLVIAVVFFVSMALAGVSGVLDGLYYQGIQYTMGFTVGIVGFTAAVVGGLGNPTGAVVGAFALGALEAVGTGYLGSEWQDVFAFSLLIIALTLRPTGLVGERIVSRA